MIFCSNWARPSALRPRGGRSKPSRRPCAAWRRANRGQVLAIAAREVPDVRAAVDAAQAQVPRAVVLVFADGPAEKELGAALKGRVFAVLAAYIEPRKHQAG